MRKVGELEPLGISCGEDEMKTAVRTFLGTLLALAVLAGGVCLYFVRMENDYTNIIAANWKITLPKYDSEVYRAEDNGFGDGICFHVFHYADCSAIDTAVGWQTGLNTEVRQGAEEILDQLDVPQEEHPDLDGDFKWYTVIQSEDERNHLYLLWVPAERDLYVLELFM
jgi:hypothetical protein